MVILKCEKCNKEFKVKNYRKNTARFCSYKCNASLLHSLPRTKKWRDKIGKANKGKVSERKGLSYKEIYRNRAEEEIKKRTDAQHKRWDLIGRKEIYKNRHQNWEYVKWRKIVFERDNYTCQNCKKNGGELRAHHIYNWVKYPKLRFYKRNGVTLCNTCHKKFHKIYGQKDNNKEQLKEFFKIYKIYACDYDIAGFEQKIEEIIEKTIGEVVSEIFAKDKLLAQKYKYFVKPNDIMKIKDNLIEKLKTHNKKILINKNNIMKNENEMIFKYPIEIENFLSIEMPMKAKVLSVGVQNNKAYIWAMVNESNRFEERIFRLMGTGHPTYSREKDLCFIGTFQLKEKDESIFVGHLFEVINKEIVPYL